jgi:hypothetical protein
LRETFWLIYNTAGWCIVAKQKRLFRYLSHFPQLAAAGVGPKVGEGFNHTAYRYKKKWVLKVPRSYGSYHYSNQLSLLRDLQLIRRYFPQFAITTIVVMSRDGSKYCMLQPFYSGSRKIVPHRSGSIRQSLQHIWTVNQRLRRETGYAVDLVGGAGYVHALLSLVTRNFQPYLSNLILTTRRSQRVALLVDIELLRLSRPEAQWQAIISWLLSWSSYLANRAILRVFFRIA